MLAISAYTVPEAYESPKHKWKRKNPKRPILDQKIQKETNVVLPHTRPLGQGGKKNMGKKP
jgi:hypothetical protein